MEPTNILGNVKLYNADCMEVMKTFKDKQFSLAIIDPPYGKNPHRNRDGMGVTKRNFESGSTSWDKKPLKNYWDELFRVSENQIVWGANYFIENLYSTNSIIFWDKEKTFKDYADGELAWTSFTSGAKLYNFAWNGMIQGNMKNKEERIHPTQKPVQLYKWLLQNYAKEGDTILDTHFGSLSIGIACHDMKFDLTAIELDKDYYEQAKKRLEFHQRQLTLF